MDKIKIVAALVLAALLAGGLYWGGYSRAAARYEAEIASLRQRAAENVARQIVEARVIEAKRSEIKTELEWTYGALVEKRTEARNESGLLEHDLAAALGRLRDAGASGGSACLPGGADNAESCAELRKANAQLARTVERLAAGGSRLVAEGQRGADVAGIAAEAARRYQNVERD